MPTIGRARWTPPADPKNGAPSKLSTAPSAVAPQKGNVVPPTPAKAWSCRPAATTTSLPVTIGVTNRSAWPVGKLCMVAPVAGLKAYSRPPPASSAHTAPPATIGGPPLASDVHRGANVAAPASTLNALTGPLSQLTYNTPAE